VGVNSNTDPFSVAWTLGFRISVTCQLISELCAVNYVLTDFPVFMQHS
jgi:hypothetical protein